MEEMQRISVWAHVLEHAEDMMDDVSCMISSFGVRCGDVAFRADDTLDPEERQKRTAAAVELLYEARIHLRLLANNLEHHSRHLNSIRTEALKAA